MWARRRGGGGRRRRVGVVGAVGGAAHVLAWLARSADLFSSASVLSRFCSMMSTFCCLRRAEAGAGVAEARASDGLCRHRRGAARART